MKLTVNLAGTNIAIVFLGEAKKAIHLCNQYFRNFLYPAKRSDATITVSVFRKSDKGFPVWSTTGNPVFEQLLSAKDMAAWLSGVPDYENDFPITEKMVASFCMDGLLLFDPDTAAGRIYLLKQGPECFKPLYRLFWMYFAQVCGEIGACFIHAAALVKDQKGYIFIGDSGAGKSTLANLCTECVVLSDDSPIFRKQDGEYHVLPSPFHQLNHLKGIGKEIAHMSAKVNGLYFLTKDVKVYLENISKKETISMIINRYIHFFSYLSNQARSGIFSIIYEACNTLPAYNFHFCKGQNMWSAINGE